MIDSDIYEDTSRWHCFKGKFKEEIWVYARCPDCGKFLKLGKLLMNEFGDFKLQGWFCKRHGEVEPFFEKLI